MNNMFHNVKVTEVMPYTAAGTSSINGTEIDMQGFEGVMFVANFGTAASDNTIHAEQDTATGMASAADLANTSVGVGSSDETVILDIVNPQERFVRCVADRGTSTTLETCYAFQYGSKKLPIDNTVAGTIHGELHVAPAEGTK